MLLFIISVCIHLLYFGVLLRGRLYIQRALSMNDGKATESAGQAVSIIVPFRNEEAALSSTAQRLKNSLGSNREHELILVDDHSTDRSAEVAAQCIPEAVLLTSKGEGKKAALSTGVEKAAHEVIYTLDADISISDEWHEHISREAERVEQGVRILGVIPTSPRSICQSFGGLEFIALQAMTIASAEMGKATMANGANLMFDRALALYETSETASGDDINVLHSAKSQGLPVSVSVSTKSTVKTDMPATWSGLWSQRKRWAAKTSTYQDKDSKQLAMLIFAVNLMSCVTLPLSMLSTNVSLLWVMCLFMIKIAVETLFILPLLKHHRILGRLSFLIPFGIFYPTYVTVLSVASQITGFTWKDRHFKK